MVSTPFLTFYVIGIILQSDLVYLVKFGLLVATYIVLHFGGQYFFDDRLMNLLPMSIYLATKVCINFLPRLYFVACRTYVILMAESNHGIIRVIKYYVLLNTCFTIEIRN